MLRITVQTSDASMAVNVGGHVEVDINSFEVSAPELEAFLQEYVDAKERAKSTGASIYWIRSVIGAEIID